MYGSLLVLYALPLCCILPIASTNHFLGGTIMVRPKPGSANTDLEVEITSHISLRRSDNRFYCDSSTLANTNTTITTMNFYCQYGCHGFVTIPFFCTEYSVQNDWSYLEGHEMHVLNVTDVNAVTIGTVNDGWVNPYGRWNISTTFSLVPRADTGQINSSPRVVSFPKLQLLEGRRYNISLTVIDPDGDEVRCRWAIDSECSSVCNSIPGAVLDPNSCTIRYHANFGTGLKAVAIMIEDFVPNSFAPLSSVAHQFLVEVINFSQLSCTSESLLYGWYVIAPQETCKTISPSMHYSEQLMAMSLCPNVSITSNSVQIIAPIGTIRGEPQQIEGIVTDDHYHINISWTPTANQQNDTHLLCYISGGFASKPQSCIKLAVGYHPPSPLRESATPNHQFVYPSNNTLQIMFDRKIQRPSTPAFIRFYNSREVVYQIDTSSSLEVNFDGPNLTIVPNYVFTKGNNYFVTFDGGVVESIEGCHLGNIPIFNETFWNFEILKLIPDVIADNNQTVGQPLILQCSVTTIRDINNRVDFVWISNGRELERVEGVTGGSLTNNLGVYTDYYIIPQLSIADNNSLYTCEVIINRSPLTSLSATGNITLNIGAEMMNNLHDNSTLHLCSSLPQFVEPTLPPGVCVAVPSGTLFIKQIRATSDSCSNNEITSIKVFGPNGVRVGELQHVQSTNNYYYINIAWMPTADQQNTTGLLCFVAVNVAGLNSEPLCMELAAGYLPPAPIPESANHQLVYPSNTTLNIMFDRTIQRPSTSAFIRFYKLGEEVYQIDVSLSTEVTFTESSLAIEPNYNFTEGSTYYINFDRGVVQSNDFINRCHLANEQILSRNFWSFEAVDVTSEVMLMNATCVDDSQVTFIVLFAISITINLLICITVVTCCLRRIFGKDHGNQTDPESLAYNNISFKEVQLSTIQEHVNPAVEDNVTIQMNPSYLAFCSNHQEKPTAEDKMNPSYLSTVSSSPQQKPAAENKMNAEEKYAYITIK